MASLTRFETAQYLAKKDHFTILTHRRPDGDTIGSAAALCLGLRQLGKTAHVLPNPEITPKYAPLLEGLTKPAPETGDTLISVDSAVLSMLPEPYQELSIDLRIDHHGNTPSYTADELVDPETAACGEIVYDVLMSMYIDMTAPIANALYTAVSTDTGCFRYANTTSHTFAVAAACAWASKDIFTINRQLFETVTLGRLRLQGWLVENALFLQDGKVAICPLPRQKELELELTEDDLENISGFPRTIAGVKLAATLREEADGGIKLSVRTVPGCNAAAVCEAFGGGGHQGAAGATLDMTMDEAVKAVIAAIPAVE